MIAVRGWPDKTPYLILINVPWQLQDVPMRTKESRLPWWNYRGQMRWAATLESHEQLLSPPLSPARSGLNSTPRTDLIWSVQLRNLRPARGERSESRREEVCKEWASISSFFLLFLGVKRMCNPASGTTTRTVVGLKHGKHFSEKPSIAMWPRTKPPTQRWKNPLPLHSWWIWSTHKPWGKKPLSVSETPSGIQDVSPPEIFPDKIRATAEPLPSYNPGHVLDLYASLWTVPLNGEGCTPTYHWYTKSNKISSTTFFGMSNQKQKTLWISQTATRTHLARLVCCEGCKLHRIHSSARASVFIQAAVRFTLYCYQT